MNAEEIRSAEKLWIKSIQNQSFSKEVCHLISIRKSPVPILVWQFDLYLDNKGIARCKGRIQNSLLNQEVKTPMLDLIIRETHHRMLHSRVNTS